MAEEKPITVKEIWQKHRKEVVVGLVTAIFLLVAGAVIFRHFTAGPGTVAKTVNDGATVGKINITKVLKAHSDYAKLENLKKERRELQLKLQQTVTPKETIKMPVVEDKPFSDAVFQKNAQLVMSRKAELDRKQRQLTEEYHKDTADDYATQKDKIDKLYVNALVNIKMKLDNADVMRLSEDTVAALLQEKDRLQRERGEKQRELAEYRESYINEKVRLTMANDYAELKKYLDDSTAKFKAEALAKQTAAGNRNTAAMEENIKQSQQKRQDTWKLQEAIAAKDNEIKVLESHIMNDVVSKATKLAIMHHLTLIYVDKAASLDAMTGFSKKTADSLVVHDVVFTDADDITEELIQELTNN